MQSAQAFFTTADLEQAASRAGNHFFDRDAKRFFRSRILSDLYQGPGGIYFVTSEQFQGSEYAKPRAYTVRRFVAGERVRESDGRTVPTVSIDTVGEFNVLTRAEAVRLAKRAALGVL